MHSVLPLTRFNPGADLNLTHLKSWQIRLRKCFDKRLAGSMKSRPVRAKITSAQTTCQPRSSRIGYVQTVLVTGPRDCASLGWLVQEVFML